MEQFIYYFLVRLLLFPATFLRFGYFLAKAVNHFLEHPQKYLSGVLSV